MDRKTVIIGSDDFGWAEAQVASGAFSSASAYVSELIRRDREDIADLQAKVDSGRASGIIDRDATEVLREIMAANRAARG